VTANLRIRCALFWATLAVVALISLEFASFAVTRLRADLFDQREQFLDALNPADFERAQATASNLLGWDNPASAAIRERNCAGEEVVSTLSSWSRAIRTRPATRSAMRTPTRRSSNAF
jgi:hypothetical protein